ncbi:arfGAP with SH3 domain, ANK repeat and PH domain-containing protein-like isoform X1 [Varroa jacobsoni]|uniref:arfGAP with SH3 domain, ANK repeat and PH domain-containing protein-like isoform X1 n=1 Tax=Varroa jacobsoni TaxID=62625 RepID=UPI000BFA5670|nr:arfGAP with SH3 domain, ANK repeat and PH domain-containing protein-like isoform X1 [Varroa jacobsoni]
MQMTVEEFVAETLDDHNSPTTSQFVNKINDCRQTVANLEESLDFDRDGLSKLKKAIKAVYNSGTTHVDNELYLSKALEKLGSHAMSREGEPDIGAAFIKFSIVAREVSSLMKTLMQSLHNIIMFPVENLLKGDLRGVKGDLKRPFDKAYSDYERKLGKIEKEKKAIAKEAGMIRTEMTGADLAEEMEKERRCFQLHMCDYLLRVNEVKTRKGVELLQHLVEFYHAQNSFFQDGIKTIGHFQQYVNELSAKLQTMKAKQDEERKKLLELKNTLKNCTPSLASANATLDSTLSSHGVGGSSAGLGGLGGLASGGLGGQSADGSASNVHNTTQSGYSLHQLQGNQHYGTTKTGYLSKKSDGKMRRVWQKRRCEVADGGFLSIYHSDESKPPTRLNLLTCQLKLPYQNQGDERQRCFDLVSYNRTYHFQAEDDADLEAWKAVLLNVKEGALRRAFSDSAGGAELREQITRQVQSLPGNDRCVDCGSTKDVTWLATNFGIITCIECSGVHREMGVHISRIQSLTLDNLGTSQLLLARVMGNHAFNEVMEATIGSIPRPTQASNMDERSEFIRAKYMDKEFVLKTCSSMQDLLQDTEQAIQARSIHQLLQSFAEGVDFSLPLPSCQSTGETALHVAIKQVKRKGSVKIHRQGVKPLVLPGYEDGTSLHLVDFLVQNGGGCADVANVEGCTPLHTAVQLRQTECIKLLLKSGARYVARNAEGKTAADIAREKGYDKCLELIEHAAENKKSLFENVNLDFGSLQAPGLADDGSTDFSDDEYADEKLSEWRTRGSRPSSVISTDLLRAESPLSRKKVPQGGGSGAHSHTPSSVKKRVAPNPPQLQLLATSTPGKHNRSPSDPMFTPGQLSCSTPASSTTSVSSTATGQGLHGGQSGSSAQSGPHKRNLSMDVGGGSGGSTVGGPSLLDEITSTLGRTAVAGQGTQVQRPKFPPPPKPPINGAKPESIIIGGAPVSTTKTTTTSIGMNPSSTTNSQVRRCRALYNCRADADDELSFKEGDIILITKEKTEDEDWMEGMLQNGNGKKALFPVSFVDMID